MTAKVIQGSFLAGQPKLPPPIPARLPPPIQAKTVARPPGPAAPAVSGRPPGPPAPAFGARLPGPAAPAFAARNGAVQRHGNGGAFAVEAGQVGLLSSGGRPLPDAVRGKMEAALGADFSNVRVHVGPQAERIGAIAFTLGSDIYFAPGRYQPDTVHGRQLLGHELAHVVQQRAGRVRNPLGSGIAVVQDHALEAEADRLGRHAAAHRVTAQAKPAPGAPQPTSPVSISPPVSTGPGSYRLTAGAGGRPIGSVMVHARDRGSVEVTDLRVEPSHREHGIGKQLLASAARTGQRFGKAKVTLAAQDNGSGRLTRWYKGLGFSQVGVNQHGYPQLEAPISQVLGAAAQRSTAAGKSRTFPSLYTYAPHNVWLDAPRPLQAYPASLAIQPMDAGDDEWKKLCQAGRDLHRKMVQQDQINAAVYEDKYKEWQKSYKSNYEKKGDDVYDVYTGFLREYSEIKESELGRCHNKFNIAKGDFQALSNFPDRANEKLRNSDVVYFQFQFLKQQLGKELKLLSVTRTNVVNKDSQPIISLLTAHDAFTEGDEFSPADAAFYVYLNIPNVKSSCWFAQNWGVSLGLGPPSKISLVGEKTIKISY